MRSNIPLVRLPAKVLDEEIDMVVDMGVDLRLDTPIESMGRLLDEGYDAVFVGSGAPHGQGSQAAWSRSGGGQYPHRHRLAGVGGLRARRAHRRAGADHRRRQHRHGLLSHLAAPGRQRREGDGAQAACTTSRRRTGSSRMPRRSASRSSSAIRPEAFVIEDGRLTGMRFDVLEYHEDEDGRLRSTDRRRGACIPATT